MKHIEMNAPAKINIGLHVLNKRNDGYHNLHTLFYPICDLYDKLKFTLADESGFTCNNASIPNDESNLVVKAKLLLENYFNKKLNVKIELEKNIPSQAGLGGGSSDAASTLISLNEMFNLNLNYDKLINLALSLGSDVPFFIKAKPAIGKSRGEILEYIELEINEYIVLVKPDISISTKEAFDNIHPSMNEINYKSVLFQNKVDYKNLREYATNDFEEFVFKKYPEIEKIKNELCKNGALYASLSGSGSTVFGMFCSEEEAKKSIMNLPKNYFCWISTPHR